MYLVNQVFSKMKTPLIIAGRNPSSALIAAVANHPHISIKANINTQDIDELIKTSQINVLPTFQATGIKLKLLVALFYNTGMRLSELINMKESQIDFSRSQLKF